MIVSVDLDNERASRIEAIAIARGTSVQQFVMEAIDKELAGDAFPRTTARFTQRVHDFGAHIDTTWTMLADLDIEEYQQKTGKK
jgi:hypothetical protein